MAQDPGRRGLSFFFSSRRRHTRCDRDWSSDVCSSDLAARSARSDYARGRRVNLERALRAADRLGGHLVQGHVDGVAEVVRVEGPGRGDALVCDLRVPRGARAVCIPQGSITVDGVSLTINALPGPDLVQVALIPFTRAHTTLGALRVGERVHVEGDLLGKYVRQLCGTER